MAFTAAGVLTGTPTARQGFSNFVLNVADVQLPTTTVQTSNATVQLAVGPDAVIITESSSTAGNTVIDGSYDNNVQTVEVFEMYSAGGQVRLLSDGPTPPSDMAATHVNPSLRNDGTNGGRTYLKDMLLDVDFLRVGVIPTSRYYDVHQLNTKSARAWQHCDSDRKWPFEAIGGDVSSRYPSSAGAINEGGDMTSNSAVELPETAVAHSPATGVYADGGLLYGFDGPNCFGFFVVRKDSKIYVPCASTSPGRRRRSRRRGRCSTGSATAGARARRRRAAACACPALR
jgi:hypothetical protein